MSAAAPMRQRAGGPQRLTALHDRTGSSRTRARPQSGGANTSWKGVLPMRPTTTVSSGAMARPLAAAHSRLLDCRSAKHPDLDKTDLQMATRGDGGDRGRWSSAHQQVRQIAPHAGGSFCFHASWQSACRSLCLKRHQPFSRHAEQYLGLQGIVFPIQTGNGHQAVIFSVMLGE